MAQPFTGLYEHRKRSSNQLDTYKNHKPQTTNHLMDVYRYVPTLALTRLHDFGKASTMSTPLCAVLGWFLGLGDRRNTPVLCRRLVPDRVRIFGFWFFWWFFFCDTPSETPDLDLNLIWR
ncbi:hypothetical protein LB505_002764 [Fusarium chuoi]|nr:hypothetical protein LB505_002764 [Fusarium chuoi]